MSEELRGRLREAAEAHRPDRERMLARLERGMARPLTRGERAAMRHRRPVAGWARVAGVTAAVASVVAAGGFALGAAVRDDGPEQMVSVSPPPETSPSPSATRREPAPTARPSRAPSAPAGRSATPSPPASHAPRASASPSGGASGTPGGKPAVSDAYLWSDGSVDPGSNDYWAQSDVTFKTEERLTELTVELRVARTGQVADTGNWRSLPADDFTVSVGERDGFLVYRWELRPGRTVPVGEHVFAGQFNHAPGGRDAKDDSYTVTGRAAGDGERVTVGGGFAATDG